ncbi:MAG: hypothetical protein PWP23_3237 [Candidatus Sumerlaeota bacterium]|nr:hypothetical protein [Candidatus Sumerlaeota bacterium]
MKGEAFLTEARRAFHAAVLDNILSLNEKGIPSNADGSNPSSRILALGIYEAIGIESRAARLAGQCAGNKFETICLDFISSVFLRLRHLRPGSWHCLQITGRGPSSIARFEQYAHLLDLKKAAEENRELASIVGSDYIISPDLVVFRDPEEDAAINRPENLVDHTSGRRTPLRHLNNELPILHASISCKWTLRSDRAQNARTEAINLIKNRKGHLPHVMVVTGEPTPNRIASLALGTGEIDCVYHFALPEMHEAAKKAGNNDAMELIDIMVEGRRLRDIADLPLDLAL